MTQAMPSSANDCRVLVVDDDAVIRTSVTRIFARFGYPVANAGGSAAAFDLACRTRYDLVLSDFDMPVLDGFQLACCIKQEDPGTKVVVMTGNSKPQVAVYMDRPEVDGWLFKPFGLQALSTVMTRIELPNAFQARLPQKRAVAG
jgi:CheY-like chemotaxis protein